MSNIDTIIQWLDEGKDYDEESSPESLEERVRAIFSLDDGEHWEGYAIGGADRWNEPYLGGTTPNMLYRALFIFRPKDLSFDYMYKGFIFGVLSPCKQFMVGMEWWKYEFALRYYCARRKDVGGQMDGVIAGWPSADNGVFCSNEEGNKFFGLIRRLLEREWLVYDGNDFRA